MTTKELLDFYYKGFAKKSNWENVAEHWTIKNDKLQSLTIYFDTLTFANNSK